MPLYDFICDKCEKTQEKLIKREDIDKQICECGTLMHKSDVVTKMSFQLKGIWFKTHKRY